MVSGLPHALTALHPAQIPPVFADFGGLFQEKPLLLSPEFAARIVHPVGSNVKRVNVSMMFTVVAMEESSAEK